MRRAFLLLLLLSGCHRDPAPAVEDPFRLADHLAGAASSPSGLPASLPTGETTSGGETSPGGADLPSTAVELARSPLQVAHWDFSRPDTGFTRISGKASLKPGEEGLTLQIGPAPLMLASSPDLDLDPATVQEAVVRLRTDRPGRLLLQLETEPDHPPAVERMYHGVELEPSADFRDYVIPLSEPQAVEDGLALRRLWLRPTDATGGTVEIREITLRSASLEYDRAPVGVTWEGLGGRYQRSLFVRPGHPATVDLTVPASGTLTFSSGALPSGVVGRFQVEVFDPRTTGPGVVVWTGENVPGQWRDVSIDLQPYAGHQVRLELSVEGGAGLIGLWGSAEVRKTHSAHSKPNILIYLVDCLRLDTIGAIAASSEGKIAVTPTLDRLASRGVVFDQAWAPSNWTRVSVPAIFTGRRPSEEGVMLPGDALSDRETTLAERLHAAGYATGAMVASPFAGRLTHLEQGYDELTEAEGIIGTEVTTGSATRIDALAQPWLERHRERPFFLYLHTLDTHFPYGGTDRQRARFAEPALLVTYDRAWPAFRDARRARGLPQLQNFLTLRDLLGPPALQMAVEDFTRVTRALYQSGASVADDGLGRILKQLDRLGLADDTIVVVIADHGEAFLEHGELGHGGPLYEELLHVPWIVSWPGHLAPRRIAAPVSLVDLAPTVLELAGLAAPAGLSGRSLAGPLRGEKLEVRPVVAEAWPDPNPSSRLEIAIRDGRWKLRTWRENGQVLKALYDLEADPGEKRDLAVGNPDVAARLHAAIPKTSLRTFEGQSAESKRSLLPSSQQIERLRALGYTP